MFAASQFVLPARPFIFKTYGKSNTNRKKECLWEDFFSMGISGSSQLQARLGMVFYSRAGTGPSIGLLGFYKEFFIWRDSLAFRFSFFLDEQKYQNA